MRKIICVLFTIIFLYTCVSGAEGAAIKFKEGDKGKEVTAIQNKLVANGYHINPVNGIFNKQTTVAIKEFQKKQKLTPNGIVDDATYRALMGTGSSNSDQLGSAAWRITNTALQYKGVPYRFGGSTPQGFDCSGFLMYVFEKNGKKLPRTADEQYKIGKAVTGNELRRGDLVFFTTYEKGASHCGIYLDSKQFIHASSSRGVMISRLDETYWRTRYLGARRVLE